MILFFAPPSIIIDILLHLQFNLTDQRRIVANAKDKYIKKLHIIFTLCI